MSNNLSVDQQQLLHVYMNQYTQTHSHIERLYDMLDETRDNILNILSSNRNTNTNRNRRNRNRNRNTNNIANQRPNHNVSYDYNSPINPSLYHILRNENNENNARQSRPNINVNRGLFLICSPISLNSVSVSSA
jgi:hypothetical protein